MICALDHLSDFQELLDSDVTRVTYQQTGEAKNEIIRALAEPMQRLPFRRQIRLGSSHRVSSVARKRWFNGQH